MLRCKWFYESTPGDLGIELKLNGARSDCFRFFSNFLRFWYQEKAHIFLITLSNVMAEKCIVWKILIKM